MTNFDITLGVWKNKINSDTAVYDKRHISQVIEILIKKYGVEGYKELLTKAINNRKNWFLTFGACQSFSWFFKCSVDEGIIFNIEKVARGDYNNKEKQLTSIGSSYPYQCNPKRMF